MIRVGRTLTNVALRKSIVVHSRGVPVVLSSVRALATHPPTGSGSGAEDREKKSSPPSSSSSSAATSAAAEEAKKASKLQVVLSGAKTVGVTVKGWVMNPRQTWQSIKEEAHHYWLGSKLLWSEVQITSQILKRVVTGSELTRRERKQLVRTSMDLFRLIPFAIIVAVPFMELLLPVLLKVFPNMLPSTFEDKAKRQESMQKELQMRLAVAKFMQETLQEIASKKSGSEVTDVKELTTFIDNARLGVAIPNDKVIQMAKLFKDELTLANIARPQLLALCRYMGLQTYGTDSFLRYQLRTKLRDIKEDDRRILWEGVDSLNSLELREACRERGMQSIGLTQFKLKHQLTEWLELSTEKGIPISLLIMSRAFSLTSHTDDPEVVLKSSMSALDTDTINEVVLAAAPADAENSIELRKRKIESFKFQQELIQEEIVGAEELKKKRAAEKAALEQKAKAESLEATLNAASAAAAAKANAEFKPIAPSPSNAKESVEGTNSAESNSQHIETKI